MRKSFLLAVVVIVLIFALTGCGPTEAERGEHVVKDSGLVPDITTYKNSSFSPLSNNLAYQYAVDNRTGVVYLSFRYDRGGGITVMLNADGTPVTIDQISPGAKKITIPD